jgi:hypothetical protein
VSELEEIVAKAKYLKEKFKCHSATLSGEELTDICELVERLARQLVLEKINRLTGEQS